MNIAKELKIGMVLTLLFIFIVMVAMLGNNKQTNTTTTSQSPTITTTPESGLSTYSMSEVAKHNTAGDCWLVINNNVYNATDYLDSHPGGVQAITQYCGADATTAYTGMPKHGARANADLAKLIIGKIK
jgi:cytochrome b involved in lipid metabolism